MLEKHFISPSKFHYFIKHVDQQRLSFMTPGEKAPLPASIEKVIIMEPPYAISFNIKVGSESYLPEFVVLDIPLVCNDSCFQKSHNLGGGEANS